VFRWFCDLQVRCYAILVVKKFVLTRDGHLAYSASNIFFRTLHKMKFEV